MAEKESWEHIAPELPPGWSVENSGDMDYQQNWATRAADGTVTERGFCGREYAVEDCWEQFGITRKRYAKLIAVERLWVAAGAKYGRSALDGVIVIAKIHPESCVFEIVWRDALSVYESEYFGPTLCDAAWACIKALGGGE